MTRKTIPRKGKGWHRVSCQKWSVVSQDRCSPETEHLSHVGGKISGEKRGKNIVTGHWPQCHHRHVTSGGLSPGMMGSCVRIDLNHLSMHEHSRRRRTEKVLKKNESQRCVKGDQEGRLMNY